MVDMAAPLWLVPAIHISKKIFGWVKTPFVWTWGRLTNNNAAIIELLKQQLAASEQKSVDLLLKVGLLTSENAQLKSQLEQAKTNADNFKQEYR